MEPTPLNDGDPTGLEAAGIARLVDSRLRELRRLIRSSVALRAFSLLAAAVVGLSAVSFLVDRSLRLPVPGRAAALAILGAALAWLAWRLLVRPLGVVLSDRVLADLIERRYPEIQDRFRSAVEFRAEPDVLEAASGSAGEARAADIGAVMKRRVLAEAAAEIASKDPAGIVDTSRVASCVAAAVVCVAAAAVLAAVWSGTFDTWFRRNLLLEDIEWPYRTRLVVEGFGEGLVRGVPRGDPLAIRVRAEGEVPQRVRVRLLYDRESLRFNMAREGGAAFVHEHPEVTEAFRFVVEGGDFRSREHRVIVKERPEVAAVRLTLTYPAYTGKAEETLEKDIGELAVPEGTSVAIDAAATKGLRGAWLEAEGKRIDLAVSPADARRFGGTYVPAEGGMATIHLEDLEDVPPSSWFRFLVSPVPDRLPIVLAQAEGIGSMIAPAARIPLKVRAQDDYKVTAIGVEHEVAREGEEPRKGATPFPPPREPGPIVEEAPAFEVGPLGIEPERRLDIRVTAVDNDGIRGPKTGYAAAQSYLVVTPEKLLEDFLRREEEARRALERVVADERSVRDSCYRLIDESWRSEGPLADAAVREMVAAAKTQRQLSRQVSGVSGAVRQILEEMRNNRVAELSETERLSSGIIDPLNEVSETLLPAAAVKVAAIREMEKAADRVREGLTLASDIESIIARLEAVLANLRRLEGFTEIVNRLRGIIKVHEESRDAARKTYEREIKKLFDDPTDGSGPGSGGPLPIQPPEVKKP
jgi:hypothetical protein